jgi:hypothetical protein
MMPPKRNQPTPERRNQVKALAGFGLRQEEICAIVGLRSPKTLRRHYQRELAAGVAEATTKVRQTAFQLATSGRDPRSTIFWLKTRGYWSRQMDVEERIVEEFVIEDYPIPLSMIQQVHRGLGLNVSPKFDDPIDAA